MLSYMVIDCANVAVGQILPFYFWIGYDMITNLQKGSLTKRASAFLLDGILLVVLVTGLAFLLSSVLNYGSYTQMLNDCYDKYEQQYGVEFGITHEKYEQFSPEEKANFDAASEALGKDKDAAYAYNMMVNLMMVIVSLSILGSFLLLEFAVPVWFGNGQTLGKKIFGLAVMRTDSVKVNTVTMFVRTILGKFTIETMMPLMICLLIVFGGIGILGTAILGLILLLQVIIMVTSHTNAMIHDKLANTVVVDMASQMIFGSDLELIAYKEKLHAEKSARQGY